MIISFDELRNLKHSLPTGSISKIAQELNVSEQTVRNYFGAQKFEDGEVVGQHVEPGPNGGLVTLDDTTIYDLAQKIVAEAKENSLS